MRNKILNAITAAAGCGFWIFAASFNERTTKAGFITALIGITICGAWLLLFSKANEDNL